jgi:hypothetical protein
MSSAGWRAENPYSRSYTGDRKATDLDLVYELILSTHCTRLRPARINSRDTFIRQIDGVDASTAS